MVNAALPASKDQAERAPLRPPARLAQPKLEAGRKGSWPAAMTEYQKDTAFLRRLIALDKAAEGRLLEARLAAAERNDRVLRRAMLGVTLLLALSLTGLGYSAILLPDFPFNRSQLVLKLFLALALGSGLCLVGYACMWMRSRQFLNQLRDECRRALEAALADWRSTDTTLATSQAVNKAAVPVYQAETVPTVGSLSQAA